LNLAVVPDRVFALEFKDQDDNNNRAVLSVSVVIDGEFFRVNEGMGSDVAGGNEIGGRCPPDPLGFIAYRLAPAG